MVQCQQFTFFRAKYNLYILLLKYEKSIIHSDPQHGKFKGHRSQKSEVLEKYYSLNCVHVAKSSNPDMPHFAPANWHANVSAMDTE